MPEPSSPSVAGGNHIVEEAAGRPTRVNNSDEPARTTEALRERISKLAAASLRISASLDLDTVLHEIVENARELTGARYAAIATMDEGGEPREFVTSGFTEDEHRRLAEWPDGPRLFEHFRDLSGPMRVADLPAFVRPLGFSGDRLPSTPAQGTPMRHRGQHVGNFYLVEKEGGKEFTGEDEEILMLFASQAATAIANARTHREERRARADLEALVETTPVGVAVFEAKTGKAVLLNREAKRIVTPLQLPGRPLEDLLKVLTCRFADGREINLDALPLAEELVRAKTVRAEEIELSTPDGRSVTTSINATPIRSENDAVASVVVTLQDLAPLKELERMRAEFLGMVSHELRTPLTSIRGSTNTVLDAAPAFSAAEMLQFFHIIDEQARNMSGLIGDLLNAGRIDTGTLSVAPEPSDLAPLVDQARSTFLSTGNSHSVLVELPPDLPRVMVDRQRIVQVLNNLFSNAARHSPDASPIHVRAIRDGAFVEVSVSDLGRGIPPERLPHLFQKYTRTDGERGVRSGLGLAICKGLVEAHGGRIRAASNGLNQGARFTFTLPTAENAAVDGDVADPGQDARRAPRGGLSPARVLVVDDDPRTLRFVRDTLTERGYATAVTGEVGELARVIHAEKPQLVLLDLMLPGTDGIKLMESVPELADLPVIFISAYGRDETIARALEAGAADYIVKPFSPMELTARVRAALRRHAEFEPFVLGDLTIDYDRRRVSVAGCPVRLTATEYELLRILSINAGRVLSYAALVRQVWGGRRYGNPKLVRMFIGKLRRKLGDDANAPTYILTERGAGYCMARPGHA